MVEIRNLWYECLHYAFVCFSAMVLEAEQDEDGEDIPLTAMDYILHFLTFFWKLIFAFIPPRSVEGHGIIPNFNHSDVTWASWAPANLLLFQKFV